MQLVDGVKKILFLRTSGPQDPDQDLGKPNDSDSCGSERTLVFHFKRCRLIVKNFSLGKLYTETWLTIFGYFLLIKDIVIENSYKVYYFISAYMVRDEVYL
jgi:hypothetical protein